MGSKLIEVRKPTRAERKAHGGEVVFVRLDDHGRTRIVFGGRCYESWQQWGETRDILSDNVPAIERWRHGDLGEDA